MAPPKRTSGGRVTPKGTKPGQRTSSKTDHELGHHHGEVTESSRYTAPIPKNVRHSPTWVPVLMFAFFILGALTILGFYLAGGPNNWILVGGLVLILAGLYTATRYH